MTVLFLLSEALSQHFKERLLYSDAIQEAVSSKLSSSDL